MVIIHTLFNSTRVCLLEKNHSILKTHFGVKSNGKKDVLLSVDYYRGNSHCATLQCHSWSVHRERRGGWSLSPIGAHHVSCISGLQTRGETRRLAPESLTPYLAGGREGGLCYIIARNIRTNNAFNTSAKFSSFMYWLFSGLQLHEKRKNEGVGD